MTPHKKHASWPVILVTALFAAGFVLGGQRAFQTKAPGRSTAPRALRSVDDRLVFRARAERYAPRQVMVKFKPSLREPLLEATSRAYGLEKLGRIPVLEIYKFRVPETLTVEEMVQALRRNPDVEYAEPNYVAHIAATPNDPYFKTQYALLNTGQQIGSTGPSGTNGDDIKATGAWEETKGSADITIAIVDTGVDLLHPDLKAKIKSAGRDFVNDDDDATDDNGHGTMVAGIAAADTNNDAGIAGVAWNCKILPVKVIDASGNGYYDQIVAGIRWAVDNGASVINMSIGGEDAADIMRDAVKYAHDKGVVVSAAAGNNGTAVLYPAAYDAYVLAVAATDYNDARPSWSDAGPQVDVAAPGVRIACPVPSWFWAANGGSPNDVPYAFADGTSMSSPHVAGLAALIAGLKPDLSVDSIMDVIRYSADDVNSSTKPGKDNDIGYGRINMAKALVPIKITAR
jgi:thermitase